MDAAAFCARWDRRAGDEPVSDQQHADERCCCGRQNRVVLTPRRWRQVRGMASRPYRARTSHVSANDGGKRARSPGSAKETVKTIACGNAGRFRCTRCCSCAFYHYKCTRGCGCSGHPAFPTPSLGREFRARLGRIAPRDREVAFGIPRHCDPLARNDGLAV